MGLVRIYIAPLTASNTYDSYQDVTDYSLDKGLTVKRNIDNSDFNVGIFRYSSLTLNLNNITGIFADVGVITSMFFYKRSGSKVKVTWEMATEEPICGVCLTDYATLSEEVTVFEGLLNDEGSKTEIRVQDISFTVLGMESILEQVETPYSALANGDTVSAILLDCLNQTAITTLLTVSAGNISLSINPVVDDVSGFENTTVREALDNLLMMSNSILYIKDNTIYVTARTVAAAVSQTFYGQASVSGIEDIISIQDIRNGLNKTFNFLTWQDTALYKSDVNSISLYGVRKKEISFDGITTEATRNNILTDIKDEFKLPKKELKLTTVLTYDTYALDILDKIQIDYPTLFFTGDDNPLPLYGVAIYGVAVYPVGEWSLTFDSSTSFKILGKDISLSKETITLLLREV